MPRETGKRASNSCPAFHADKSVAFSHQVMGVLPVFARLLVRLIPGCERFASKYVQRAVLAWRLGADAQSNAGQKLPCPPRTTICCFHLRCQPSAAVLHGSAGGPR